MVESDLLDGHDIVSVLISGLIDDSVGALSYFADALVALGFVAS